MRLRFLALATLLALTTAASASAAPPKRIVALSPFTANTLADLGVRPVAIGNTLGGSDRFAASLKGVKRLTLSHPNGPNLEQLAALNPQLVLSSPTWSRGHAAMQRLGMRSSELDPTQRRATCRARDAQDRRARRPAPRAAATLAERSSGATSRRPRRASASRPTRAARARRRPHARTRSCPNSWGGDSSRRPAAGCSPRA